LETASFSDELDTILLDINYSERIETVAPIFISYPMASNPFKGIKDVLTFKNLSKALKR
jgi:hypothetical protein